MAIEIMKDGVSQGLVHRIDLGDGAVAVSRGKATLDVKTRKVTALTAGNPVSVNVALGNVFTLTPTGTGNINATGLASGIGSIVTLIVLTSGTTSYTLTFNTNFKSTGTLATGTTNARYFVLRFVNIGTHLVEISRTTAMA